MSGIGPKAEVDDHALLGFDPGAFIRADGRQRLKRRDSLHASEMASHIRVDSQIASFEPALMAAVSGL